MHQPDTSPARFFELENFQLQNGSTLPRVRLSYWVYGEINDAADNTILFPTWFASTRSANSWLIGDGRPLDTSRYAVVVVDAIGNGESTSPSNVSPDLAGLNFPKVSIYDNVRLQVALLDHLGVGRLALYVGRSMGAQQAFCFSACFPDRVERMFALTGSAATTAHNYVFLDGLEAALSADAAFGRPELGEPRIGLTSFGRVFAGWVLSQQYYRRGGWRRESDVNVETYLRTHWDRYFWRKNAYDLFCQIQTWKAADLSANPVFNGDQEAALAAITARTVVMPSRTDLYFPPEDSVWAISLMKNAELRVLESDYGHRAGTAASCNMDVEFLERAIMGLLQK
jgi:homoserine O-acetyltransferase/O-succinyltransferase